MKKLIFGMISTLLVTSSAFAKTSFPIVCALNKAQDLAKLNGLMVQESVKKNSNGELEQVLTLVPYEKGKALEGDKLSNEIKEFTADQIEKDEVAQFILKSGRIDPSIVKSAKSIAMSDGQPAAELINFFDKDEKMLTGAIAVPVGGIELCYPVLE